MALIDFYVNEKGFLDFEDTTTERIGNQDETVKRRLKNLILKLFIHGDFLFNDVIGERILERENAQVTIKTKIMDYIKRKYIDLEINNLRLYVIIHKQNVELYFTFINFFNNEEPLFETKIKI